MPETPDNRSTRFALRSPAYYDADSPGTGSIENVSWSGVLIGRVTNRVAPGSRITLRLSLFPGSFATPLAGRVVRVTEDGFAVEFTRLGPAELATLRKALPGRSFRA